MPKTLKLAFTGNAVLTPEYPKILQPIPGPLHAVMPGARRVRRSDFINNQINAQFAFLTFPYRHLVVEDANDRDADHKYPDTRDTTVGLCFLEREELSIFPSPLDDELTFDDSSAEDFPTKASTGIEYVARWSDFAATGHSALKDRFLSGEGDFVRVRIDGGYVSASFVSEPIALIDFDYGVDSERRAYAQEIVVTMTYPDETESVLLQAAPFSGEVAGPPVLKFYWYDASEIKILFGNGSLASINSVLSGSFAGNDHEGDFDVEFEVLYDAVDCDPDQLGRLPLPQIVSNEILRVPCVASMVPLPGSNVTSKAPVVSPAKAAKAEPVVDQAPREPGESRPQGRKP